MAEAVKPIPVVGQRRKRKALGKSRRIGRAADAWMSWTQVALILILLACAVGYALLLAYIRGEVRQLGYDIPVLTEKANALQNEVQTLTAKKQELQSPGHLEQLAASLKLAKPKPSQIVVINEAP